VLAAEPARALRHHREVSVRRWLAAVLCTATPSAGLAQDHAAAAAAAADRPRTSVRSVVEDSLRLLTMEHLTRIAAQEKTRRELGGAFWRDYRRSLRVPQRWDDGDSWLVNYVGHPGHGAAAGFLWVDHDPDGPEPIFTRPYWASRLRAAGWAATYSVQFEVGLLSEASIGNVGKDPRTIGWVDHVVTPVGGFAVMIAEDALDRYVVQRFERGVRHPVARAIVRTVLNPARATANVAGGRAPWDRKERRLSQTPLTAAAK
jgi:hypothetical protein